MPLFGIAVLMLQVDDIHFAYGEQSILDGISFSVAEGEIIALIGISGSGKTTLFRLITGLLSPSQGEILIKEQSAIKGMQLTTYMRQEDLLLPWRTVFDNLLLVSELGKKKAHPISLRKEAHALLEKVGLERNIDDFPKELSGGMRQRVSLARALLQNRPLMLLDEPFASLDVIFREQLYVLLREIRDQYTKTIVMVTHDFRDAMSLADRILVLANGKIADSFQITPEVRSDAAASEALIQQIRKHLYQSLMMNSR